MTNMKTLIASWPGAGPTLSLTWRAVVAGLAPCGIAWDKFPDKTHHRHGRAAERRQAVRQLLPDCPQAAFMRYNRLRDIALTQQQIRTTWSSPAPRLARR